MAISLQKIIQEIQEPASLAELRESILAAAKDAKEKEQHDELTVTLPAGSYFLSEPFILSATENPELDALTITIEGSKDGESSINSLVALPKGAFAPVPGKPYFSYQFPKDGDGKYPLFHDLFLNGRRIDMAKSPVWRNPDNFSPEERSGEVERKGMYVPYAIAKQLTEAPVGDTEFMMYIEWQFALIHAVGADLSDVKEIDGEKYALVTFRDGEQTYMCRHCHSILTAKNRETFFRNAPAFLNEPDTYAYDASHGILYLLPADKEAFAQSTVEYPVLENLIRLEGIKDLTLENIVFTGTTSKYVCEHPYYSGQANNESTVGRVRHAAIVTANMRNLTVKGCSFRDLGGNGLLLTDATTRATIRDSIFENISMSALSVGNPTTEWENQKNRNYAIRIENNYFHHIAYEYPSALCMYIGMVDDLKLLHNTVLECGYSAVSVGWGWCRVYYEAGEKVNIRDAEIAYNRIENYMDVLRDGGAIYVVGGNCNIENARRFNVMHDNYASLAVRRDHSKYGYYCDGSSTNWEVRDSVIVNCGTPIFSQHTVASAYTYHNHFFDIYSTTKPSMASHAPYRDSVFRDIHIVEEGEEALFEQYPEAKSIYEHAGCTLPL